jgi:antitoxin MazE
VRRYDEIELRLDGNRIVIEPLRAPRAGWFESYGDVTDRDIWPDLIETGIEHEDWEW